jgi:hypothetical protein
MHNTTQENKKGKRGAEIGIIAFFMTYKYPKKHLAQLMQYRARVESIIIIISSQGNVKEVIVKNAGSFLRSSGFNLMLLLCC